MQISSAGLCPKLCVHQSIYLNHFLTPLRQLCKLTRVHAHAHKRTHTCTHTHTHTRWHTQTLAHLQHTHTHTHTLTHTHDHKLARVHTPFLTLGASATPAPFKTITSNGWSSCKFQLWVSVSARARERHKCVFVRACHVCLCVCVCFHTCGVSNKYTLYIGL